MQTSRPRLESADVVRGLIMVIMALDHTRDYFGIPGQNPTNMATTTVALFLTRWITHFCAPTFFLLTGTGAYLSLKKKTTAELSRYLFTRGVWLIVLEATVMRFAYQFNVDYRVTFLIVIWALGWAMITLAVLVRFPLMVATVFGIVLIAGHNLLDGMTLGILHAPAFILQRPGHTIFAAYPLIPWIGVTAVGYSLGQTYTWTVERRRTFFLRAGLAMCAAFLVLRGINVYGDPSRWSSQPTSAHTVLSFLNTTKYPPSLLFLLMTCGPVLLLLRAMDGATPRVLKPALTIGRVPLFYFVVHFTLIHALAVVVCLVKYGTAHWMFESPDLAHYPFTAPPGWGHSLAGVYLVWALVVTTMYPLCRWFAALKQRRTDAWLSYL